MQQQGSKAKTPQKKRCTFFCSETPFLTNFFSKTLILHHPLKIVHQKTPKKPFFYRLKKRWPSYWPYHGQVIDPTLAKKWPSYRPYSIYIYIYIDIAIDIDISKYAYLHRKMERDKGGVRDAYCTAHSSWAGGEVVPLAANSTLMVATVEPTGLSFQWLLLGQVSIANNVCKWGMHPELSAWALCHRLSRSVSCWWLSLQCLSVQWAECAEIARFLRLRLRMSPAGQKSLWFLGPPTQRAVAICRNSIFS